jgi:hypothetical protein
VSLLSRILCPVIDGCHFQDLAPVSFAPIVELALLARAASRSLQSPIQKDSLVAMKQLIHGTDYDKSQRQRERERTYHTSRPVEFLCVQCQLPETKKEDVHLFRTLQQHLEDIAVVSLDIVHTMP